jgi:signal transduction histidine kinase
MGKRLYVDWQSGGKTVMRLWPGSLSGQMVLILFAGVMLALISSAAIHLNDRNQALSSFGGIQTAQRFATIVQLLDPLPIKERLKIVSIVETPLQFVRFLDGESPMADVQSDDKEEQHVRALLKNYLGEPWQLRIAIMNVEEGQQTAPARMMASSMPHQMPAMMMRRHHQKHMVMMNQIFPQAISFLAQVRLTDGSWVEFHNHLPKEVFTWPKHLIPSLAILFMLVIFLAFLAVRLVTRPLSELSNTAQALGDDINRSPMAVSGPSEVRQSAEALNTMQARIVRYIHERTHLLAAISHDLKTPLTRMRLRIERLADEKTQEDLLRNLTEMEGMTGAALDYIRGMEGMEKVQKVDMLSMLEKLQEEFGELGHNVHIQCSELPPFPVMPKSLKRCLNNLILNAVTYGKRAKVRADVLGNKLRISIADNGPGIPEENFEKVLEPFVRLEESRNRKTGGTGLGLAIARNVIRSHGGELKLRNRPEGGLEIILTIPK